MGSILCKGRRSPGPTHSINVTIWDGSHSDLCEFRFNFQYLDEGKDDILHRFRTVCDMVDCTYTFRKDQGVVVLPISDIMHMKKSLYEHNVMCNYGDFRSYQ